jgi:hypothetical protein
MSGAYSQEPNRAMVSPELVREIAKIIGEWEDGDELASSLAERIISKLLPLAPARYSDNDHLRQ